MIKRESEFSSLFDVPLGEAYLRVMETLSKIKSENVNKILNSSKKIIFVRHPYTRLFSAYIDKIFSVNPLYWRYFRPNRGKSSSNSSQCVYDVTFAEFVKYFLSNNFFWKKDFHFIPMYKHCSPCKLKYDFIGKIESFDQDSKYILERIGLKSLKNSLKIYKNFTRMDIIISKVKLLFSRYYGNIGAEECLTFYEAVKINWKELQIRGIIDKNINIPFSEKEITNFNKINVTDMFLTAAKKSTDKRHLVRNKYEALFEAYSSLDSSDFVNLQRIYSVDCALFNYDCRPENFIKYLSRQLQD